MNLIICMAGLYRRFRDAGYQQPKFLLPWRGRPLLVHILDAMLAEGSFATITLIANRRDRGHRSAIEACLGALGLDPGGCHFIGDTRGQAETALIGVQEMDTRWQPTDRRIVFHNIDTILYRRDWPHIGQILSEADGFIDCFAADDPCYSYVRVGTAGQVVEMKEKVVISDMATSGCYGFADADRFRQMVRRMLAEQTDGEVYISGVYDAMLRDGAWVVAERAANDDTLIFGTPAMYETWCTTD